MKTISFAQGVKLCFLVVILLKSEIREHLFESSFFGVFALFDGVYKQEYSVCRHFSMGRISPDLLLFFHLSTVL